MRESSERRIKHTFQDPEKLVYSVKEMCRNMAILWIPVVLPFLWSINLACDNSMVNCVRHSRLQKPIFIATSVHLLLVLGSLLLKHSHTRFYRLLLHKIVICTCTCSLAMLASHFLWFIVACTVQSVEGESRIIAPLRQEFISARPRKD